MFLGGTFTAAQSGLDAVERQLAVVGQNVANASTPNYSVESVPLESVDNDSGPGGVRAGGAQRAMDLALQANVLAATGQQAGSTAISTALAGVDQASGSPGSGQDLASQVGVLQDAFSALSSDPSSGSQQQAVLAAAGQVTGALQSLAGTIVQARQAAQNTLQSDVATVNSALQSFGQLSQQIVAAQAAGQSTAGLQDQRDAQMQSLSQLIGAKFVPQSTGGMIVIAGNSVLPTTGGTPFSLANVNISGATPASAVPQLMMDGNAITGLGGDMGAQQQLRDTILPGMQSQLDTFAQGMAAQFNSAGLPLFTDPGGAVPPAGTAGFASTIQVSAAVTANPSMLQDGTGPALGAGDTTVIQGVLSGVFSDSATGLPTQAANLVADFAQQSTEAQTQSTTDGSVVSGLQTRLSSETGVSVDAELSTMVQLQASYGANAKVISATEEMWQDLFGAVS